MGRAWVTGAWNMGGSLVLNVLEKVLRDIGRPPMFYLKAGKEASFPGDVLCSWMTIDAYAGSEGGQCS